MSFLIKDSSDRRMKILQATLYILPVLALLGCGSGGSSDGSQNPPEAESVPPIDGGTGTPPSVEPTSESPTTPGVDPLDTSAIAGLWDLSSNIGGETDIKPITATSSDDCKFVTSAQIDTLFSGPIPTPRHPLSQWCKTMI